MTDEQRSLLETLWPTYMHIPYLWGGSNPNTGLDCSGLVIELLQSVGTVPTMEGPKPWDRTSEALFRHFKEVVPQIDVDFGDLVFFGPTVKTISHVAFCLSNTLMLEAAGGGQANSRREIAMTPQGKARVRVRPIDNRRDLIGFKRPTYTF